MDSFSSFACRSMDRRNWNLGVAIVAILNWSDDQKEEMTPCANKKKTKPKRVGTVYIGREWSLSTCSIYYFVDPVWEKKNIFMFYRSKPSRSRSSIEYLATSQRRRRKNNNKHRKCYQIPIRVKTTGSIPRDSSSVGYTAWVSTRMIVPSRPRSTHKHLYIHLLTLIINRFISSY